MDFMVIDDAELRLRRRRVQVNIMLSAVLIDERLDVAALQRG